MFRPNKEAPRGTIHTDCFVHMLPSILRSIVIFIKFHLLLNEMAVIFRDHVT